MFSTLVESQISQLLFRQFASIARKCLIVCASYSYMSITFWTSHVFIIECLSHKFGDMRKPSICQREFSDFICVGNFYHFFEPCLVVARIKIYDNPVLKFQINIFYDLSEVIEWLIKPYPPICPSSIW
jgi:hypothetical protein